MADLEFAVVRQPVRGSLVRYQDDTVSPATQFNMEDLTTGRIAYEHDVMLSDTGAATADVFSIMACLSAFEKRSRPRTVHVAIAARNIHPPYLINHRVLKVNIGRKQYFCMISLFVEFP